MRSSQRRSPAELIEEMESGARKDAVVGVESREKNSALSGGWAGRRKIPCEILGETRHRLVVRLRRSVCCQTDDAIQKARN